MPVRDGSDRPEGWEEPRKCSYVIPPQTGDSGEVAKQRQLAYAKFDQVEDVCGSELPIMIQNEPGSRRQLSIGSWNPGPVRGQKDESHGRVMLKPLLSGPHIWLLQELHWQSLPDAQLWSATDVPDGYPVIAVRRSVGEVEAARSIVFKRNGKYAAALTIALVELHPSAEKFAMSERRVALGSAHVDHKIKKPGAVRATMADLLEHLEFGYQGLEISACGVDLNTSAEWVGADNGPVFRLWSLWHACVPPTVSMARLPDELAAAGYTGEQAHGHWLPPNGDNAPAPGQRAALSCVRETKRRVRPRPSFH
jgi:hypothetical protein